METDKVIKANIQRLHYEQMKLETWLDRHFDLYYVSRISEDDYIGFIIQFNLGAELKEIILKFPIKGVYGEPNKEYNKIVNEEFGRVISQIALYSYDFVEEKLNELKQLW